MAVALTDQAPDRGGGRVAVGRGGFQDRDDGANMEPGRRRVAAPLDECSFGFREAQKNAKPLVRRWHAGLEPRPRGVLLARSNAGTERRAKFGYRSGRW